MKRKILFSVMVIGIAALASAQHWGMGMGRFPLVPQAPQGESVTVSGSLTIAQGSLAVKSGSITYFVPGLMRYANFIDGLKDGASVRLEGTAFASPQDANLKMLQIKKLTLGGKDYDLARPAPQPQQMPMQPRMPRGHW